MRLKKVVACAIAATMVLGSLSVVTASQDEAESGQTITGAVDSWWSVKSTAQTVEDFEGAEWEFTITVDEASEGSAIAVEVHDSDDQYISTGSNGDHWYAGTLTGEPEMYREAFELEAGATYYVDVYCVDNYAEIDYYDADWNILLRYECEGISLGDTVSAYVIAQNGVTLTVDGDITIYNEIGPETLDANDTWWTVKSSPLTAVDSDDAWWSFEVTVDSVDSYITVELQDDSGQYITANSDATAWYANMEGEFITDGSGIELAEGETYYIDVYRDGSDVEIYFYDTDWEFLLAYYCYDTSLTNTVDAHIIAQGYNVLTVEGDMDYTVPMVWDASDDEDDDNTENGDNTEENGNTENDGNTEVGDNTEGDNTEVGDNTEGGNTEEGGNAGDSDNSGDSTGTTTVGGAQTGDVLPIAAILVALCGCAIIVTASRKHQA